MVRKELIDWAKQRIDKGFTVEQLRQSLKKSGYPDSDIDEIIKNVSQEAPKTEVPKKEEPPQKIPEKKEAPKEAPKKEEPAPKKEPQPMKETPKEAARIRISSLFDEEAPKPQERPKHRPPQQPKQPRESFFSKYEVGIAFFLILVAVIVLIVAIYSDTFLKLNNATPPAEERFISKVVQEELMNHHAAGVSSSLSSIVFLPDDYVTSSDLYNASGGAPVVFCAGEVTMPGGCEEGIWRVEDPCPEEYLFTNSANQQSFSSDTSQAGIHVVKPVSGELRISYVCGTYFVGFKTE